MLFYACRPDSEPLFIHGLLLGVNAHALAVLAHPLKTDLAAYLGKEGVIGADAHVFTGMNMGAALPDQNVAGRARTARRRA